MDVHTRNIIGKMATMLQEFKKRKVNLRALVDGLEGSINALEEKLPDSFYTKWYSHWGSLEQYLATGSEKQFKKEIIMEVEALEGLLDEVVR
jgi:hypothetical protein